MFSYDLTHLKLRVILILLVFLFMVCLEKHFEREKQWKSTIQRLKRDVNAV